MPKEMYCIVPDTKQPPLLPFLVFSSQENTCAKHV